MRIRQLLLDGIVRRITEIDKLLDGSTQGTTEHAMYELRHAWNVFLYEVIK